MSRPVQRSVRRSEAGVTLVEMSVALALVALGAILVVPQYRVFIAKSDLKQAAAEINSTMALARMAAMSRNTTVTVSVAMVNGRVQVSSGGILPPSNMGAQVTGVTGAPIAFNPLGLRQGGGVGNQLVTVTNSQGLTYSVAVTPGGKSRWCPMSNCS